jgi:hypothetical protein
MYVLKKNHLFNFKKNIPPPNDWWEQSHKPLNHWYERNDTNFLGFQRSFIYEKKNPQAQRFEWVSDYCLMPNEQFFTYIMARTSYIQWNDGDAHSWNEHINTSTS